MNMTLITGRLKYFFLMASGFLLLYAALHPLTEKATPEDDDTLLVQALAHWHLPDAEHYLASRLLSDPSSDSLWTLYIRTLVYEGKWRLADALLTHLQQSPEALYLGSLIAYYRGQPARAQALAESLMVYPPPWPGRGYHVRGLVAFYRGAYSLAQRYQQEALDAAQTPEDRGNALRQLGVLAWYAGHLARADSLYQEAMRAYQKANFRPGLLTTQSNRGLLLQSQGHLLENLRTQIEVLYARQQMGDRTGMADSYYFVCSHLGYAMPALCLDMLFKSFRLAEREGYAWGRDVALRAYLSFLNDYISLHTGNPIPELDTLRFTIPEGRWYLALARFRRQVEAGHPPPMAHVLAYQDTLQTLPYRDIQRAYTRLLLDMALVYRDTLHFNRWKSTLRGLSPLSQQIYIGKYWLELRNSPSNAYPYFLQATRYLDSLLEEAAHQRTPLRLEERFYRYASTRQQLYTLRMQSALRQRSPAAILETLEHGRSFPLWLGTPGSSPTWKAIAQYIRQITQPPFYPRPDFSAQLDSLFYALQRDLKTRQHTLALASNASAISSLLSTLQKHLSPDEVLLTFLPMPDSLYTFALSPNNWHVTAHAVSRTDFYQRLHFFVHLLRDPSHPPSRLVLPAYALYRLLLAPLVQKQWIKPGQHLLIIPAADLPFLPVEALSSRQESLHPLVRDHTVQYVLSPFWLIEERSKPSLSIERLVALAPTPYRLPATRQEIQHLSIPPLPVRRLMGKHVHTALFFRMLTGNNWLHFAGHAMQDPLAPLYSYLELSNRRVYLYELLQRRIHSPVVILSACETGIGGTPIPNPYRLVRAFSNALLRNGVRITLTSRWQVNDQATARFMEQFYAHLHTTGSFSQALQATQQSFIQDARWHHPAYWAAFYLYAATDYFTTGQRR